MQNEKLREFVHEKLLRLIEFIDSVCKKEGIKYSLIGGTLLGAIRHNGFIPWDDDADVVMTREEFNRFKEVAVKYLDGTPFILCKNDRVDGVAYAKPLDFDGGKIGHLCCDIFILDNAPDDEGDFKKQIFGLKKLQGMMKKGKTEWKKYSFKGKILVLGTKILGAFHSKKKILEKYTKLSTKYNGVRTKRKFIANDVYATFDIPYDNELLEEVTEHKFETAVFPVYARYDEILTAIYGDYMTPPPESERVFLHTMLDT